MFVHCPNQPSFDRGQIIAYQLKTVLSLCGGEEIAEEGEEEEEASRFSEI